jgi:tRNA A37 threonylcarbamoyladenosine biosynthesis protein TsaE
MMNEYVNGRVPLYHVDLYRMGEGGDLAGRQQEDGLGALDFLVAELDESAKKDCVIVIEWAELMDRSEAGREFLSGHEHLAISFQYVTNSDLKRLALIDAVGEKFTKLVLYIKERFGDMMEDSIS